jgi:flagellar basal-body rod modification protein FlgD
MAITATGQNAATASAVQSTVAAKDKSQLSKDDFMKLFLTELQYQDPTAPMDTEKILAQTSQLATIESADNTNQALSDLSAALSSTQEFSTIAAIGKTADLGSDAIAFDEGAVSTFEVYFPKAISQGTVTISDSDGNTVGTIDVIKGCSNGVEPEKVS